MEPTVAVIAVGTLATAVFGLSKTAVPAVGSFGAALLALVLPPVPSTGVVLPVLLVGDLIAIAAYGRRADWRVLLRLLPAVAVGLAAGFWALDRVDRSLAGGIIGLLLVASGGGELWRRHRARSRPPRGPAHPHGPGSQVLGAGAGFSTMVANAGGPMMTLYLLRLGVTGGVFLGTHAWFFFAVNALKVPLSVGLGLITAESLVLSAMLVPGIVVGALVGRHLVRRMSRVVFERVALTATTAAGLWLLVSALVTALG